MAINQDNIQVTQVNAGMNLSQPSLSIKPSQLTDSLNVEIRDGSIRSRSGFVKASTDANLPDTTLGLHHDRNFQTVPTDNFIAFGVDASNVQAGSYSTDGGTTWTAASVTTPIAMSTSYDYQVSFATAIDDEASDGFPDARYLIACVSPTHPSYVRESSNVENMIMQTSGTAWVPVPFDFGGGAVELCANKILVFFGRLVLFGYGDSSSNDATQILWSAQDDHDDLTAGSANVYITDGGGAIVDAYPLRDQLVCYKENSIVVGTRLTASPFIRWFPQVTDVGLMGPRMVGVYRDVHYFVGTNNIYAYAGGAELHKIGGPIWTQFLADLRDGGAGGTKLYRHRCFTSVHNDTAQIAFWIVTGSDDFPSKAYVYSVDDNAWTVWDSPAQLRGWGIHKHDNTINDAELIPFYADDSGVISKYDFSTMSDYVDGAPTTTQDIESYATTKDFALSLQDRNVWEEALFEVRGRVASSDVIVSASYDGGQNFDDSQSWTIENLENEVIKFRHGGGGSYKVRYKISQSGTGENGFVWNSLEIIAQAKDVIEESL